MKRLTIIFGITIIFIFFYHPNKAKAHDLEYPPILVPGCTILLECEGNINCNPDPTMEFYSNYRVRVCQVSIYTEDGKYFNWTEDGGNQFNDNNNYFDYYAEGLNIKPVWGSQHVIVWRTIDAPKIVASWMYIVDDYAPKVTYLPLAVQFR